MPKIAGKIYSKLNLFVRKRHYLHVPIENDDLEDIEDFRTRGSEVLEAIATASESTALGSTSIRTTCDEDDSVSSSSNYKSVTYVQLTPKEAIKPQKQQEGERMESLKEKTNSSGSERQSKVKRLKQLKRTIELARRKRFENQGSFAANMVTYRDQKTKTGSNVNEKGNGDGENKNPADSGRRSFGHDDRSRSSESTCKTNDVTLHVIDEDVTYHNI